MASRRVQFGPFELDLRSGELRRGNRTLVLQEQPFRVLQLILERNGELVTRPELQNLLWPNDTVVEFDNGINTAIRKLRQALGDSVEKPKYIQTVARRGYRFLAPITLIPDPIAAMDGPESQSAAAAQLAALPGKSDAVIDDEELTGKRFSHFRVLEILGGGGMGVVYKAVDLKLDRAVAIKFLPEELGSEPKAVERFEREARAASALDHPNICSIFEFGEHEGRPFLVMQLLTGKNLRDALAEHTSDGSAGLQVKELLPIALQIAAGLEAAHSKGIIHRDIKPANIFLTDRAEAKILDFGVAKLMEAEAAEAESSGANVQGDEPDPIEGAQPAHLTRTGATLGTQGYMSPEQLRGEKLDLRTDLFSFGLILYEMATGRRAFPSATASMVRSTILSETPISARAVNPELPAALDNLISKMLEKDRDLRAPSASWVLAELKSIAADGEGARADKGSEEKKGWAGRRALWWALAASTLAIAAALIATQMGRKVPYVKYTIQKAIDSQHVELTAISPDGANVVSMARDAKGVEVLQVHHIATNVETPILADPHFDIWDLIYSPDGSSIYFRARALDVPVDTRDDLFKIPSSGGQPTRVVKDIDQPISFLDGGERICFVRGIVEQKKYLFINAKADGTDERVMARMDGPVPSSASCSPDGKRAAIADGVKVLILDFASGKKDVLATMPIFGNWHELTWEPHGRGLYARVVTRAKFFGQLAYVSYPEGKLSPITNDLIRYEGTSLTADGKTMATTQMDVNQRFEVMPLIDSGHLTAHGPAGLVIFNWLDGHRIVASDEESLLRVLDVNSDQITSLSRDNRLWFIQPRLCGPDAMVASGGTLDGASSGIYHMHLDGSGATQLTQGTTHFFPECSPDGRWLYYIDRSITPADHLVRMSLAESGKPGPATTFADGFWYSLSPDGKLVAISNRKLKQMEIYSTETGKMTEALPVLPHFSQRNGFSADSKSVFFATQLEADTTIWRLPLDKSPAVKIGVVPSRIVDCIRASPDGSTLGLITIDPQSKAVLLHDSQ